MECKDLIKQLRKQIYSKLSPGEILNNLTEQRLKELAGKYEHDSDSLWIGSYIADMFIFEAKEKGDIKQHVPMAVTYAKKIIRDNDIPADKAEIILEVIETHHGGEQKHIESKLYKNADCFKFLDPKGVFYIFSALFDKDEASFKKAMQYAMFKVEEKYELVDLNEDLKKEATELYERWTWFFDRMRYELELPDLYKS